MSVNQFALDRALKSVEKSARPILKMSEAPALTGVPTGSTGLDRIFAGVGFPRNHITEVWGGEYTAKTTLALSACGEVAAAGGTAVLFDIEGTTASTGLGLSVDPANKDVLLPSDLWGEAVFDQMEYFLADKSVDLIVLDSIAALYFKAEAGCAPEEIDSTRAAVLTRALRSIQSKIRNSNTAVVFINQKRSMKIIGEDGGESWVDGSSAAKALRHAISVRVEMRAGDEIRSRDEIVGYKHSATVGKNKLGVPNRTAFFNIFANRINKQSELLREAVLVGEVCQSNKRYKLDGASIGTVKDACQFLRDNPDVFASLKARVIAHKYETAELVDLVS